MREITAILIFFPLVVADFTDMYQLNPEYNKTKFKMIRILEVLELLAPETIKHSYDEWISQHQALELLSESISGNNISFFNFIIPGVDFFRFSNSNSIRCYFGQSERSLYIDFDNESLKKSVTGNIQFLHNGNLSTCEIPFEYTLNLNGYVQLSKEKIVDDAFTPKNVIFGPLKCDEELSKYINKESQLIYKGIISQATKQTLTKMITLFLNSVFKSQQDKCSQPHINNFDTNEENYYSYHKLKRNMVMFPWTSDHVELFMTGLNDFNALYVSFNGKETQYVLIFGPETVKMRWNITTITSRQLRFEIPPSRKFVINFIVKKVNNNSEFSRVFERSVFPSIAQIIEVTQYVNIVITPRIMQLSAKVLEDTFQNIFYDGMPDFINSAKKMLQPLDKYLIQNSIIDSETKVHKRLDTTPYHKIETEGFKFHFENITCHHFNNIINGTVTYKKIIAEVEQIYPIGDENNPFSVHLSGKMYIKNAVVNISLHGQFNHKHQVEVHIDDNFNNADTTITMEKITSPRDRLPRDDRIRIGKLFRNELVQEIRNKIESTANLIFRPIFDICSNPSSSAVKTNPDHLHNQQQLFAIIHDEWIDSTEPFSIQPVEIIINGLWNFKHMIVQFVRGNVIFHDLRVENVTGSIKQGNDFNKTITSYYNASYISSTISLKSRDVQINFSADSNHTMVPIKPDISSLTQNTSITDVVNKFATIVASFIKHSIFIYDSSYSANVRKLAQKIMKKAIQDSASSEYNVTLEVADFMLKWLGIISKFDDLDKKYLNSTIFRDNISISFQHPYSMEDICDYHNHSGNQTVYLNQLIQRGNITMKDDSNDINVYIPYEVNIRYMLTADISSIDNWNTKPHPNGKLQIRLNYIEKNRCSPSFQQNNMLKKEFVELANKILYKTFNGYPSIDHWFCKMKHIFPVLSDKHFYSITKSVNYTSDHFLIYHIQLYGLQNLKFHRRTVISDLIGENEIMWTNLTANIIWTYYIGDPPPRMLKKTSLKFDVSLIMEVKNGHATLSPRSQILFSDHKYQNTSRKFRETLELVIFSSFQQWVIENYDNSNDDVFEILQDRMIINPDNLDILLD